MANTIACPSTIFSDIMDSMNKLALFAGQGAQFVGMGQDLLNDADVVSYFETANGVLGYDLSKICFEGPIETLTSSDHCQPAIFVISAACFTVFKKRLPNVTFSAFAGLSLGEWSALWAAGVLDFENTVKILEARGRFMQEACNAAPSGMVSIMALPTESVEEIASSIGLHVSNINSQGQIILSGDKDKLPLAIVAAKNAGGKALPLNVAGAFHSPFMKPAREKLATILDSIPFDTPKTPVFSNATGSLHSNDPSAIKHAMLDQITGTVRWLDCITASNSHHFVEFGPGKVLSGLAKRIDRSNEAVNVQDLASLESAISAPFLQ